MIRASEHEVLHALCVKGLAATAQIAQMTGLPEPEVERAARDLSRSGAVAFVSARRLWQIRHHGRLRHRATMLAILTADAAERLQDCHDRFLPLDRRVKELCTRWQQGEAAVTDLRADLAAVHDEFLTLAAEMSAVDSRYTGYAARLSAAQHRFAEGDETALTAVHVDSYHSAWMELHRDLRLTLGLA
jgi:hypothetical protein